jgi:hypothetical protein
MKFESFYAHIKTLLPEGMADIPKGLTLERKDNDKDYSPSNVVLATTKEQGRHRSTNRLITIGRRTACLNEWCEIRGFKSWVIRGRLRMGWSEYDAVMTPLRRKPCPSNTAPRAK